MSLFMLTAATYGVFVVQRLTFSIFLLLQGELVGAGQPTCMQHGMLHHASVSIHRTGHTLFNTCRAFKSESCVIPTGVTLPLLCMSEEPSELSKTHL